MALKLNLEESIEANLSANNIVAPPSGGRRRNRGGAEDELTVATPQDIAKAVPAAEYAMTVVLKKAYDALKKTGIAVTYAAAAAAIVYAADTSFRADLCDPLAQSLAKTFSAFPPAAGYNTKCEYAMTAYQTAVGSSIMVTAGLLIKALQSVGSIVATEEEVNEVAGELIEAMRNPVEAADKAVKMITRAKAKKDAMALTNNPTVADSYSVASKRRGGKKTKKRVVKKRKTTRRH
jgi:hypothetical protein